MLIVSIKIIRRSNYTIYRCIWSNFLTK
jgi:hypothetical protein